MTMNKQEESNSENWEHCKRIALEIENVASGKLYKCPACGEMVNVDDLDKEENLTCSDCGEEMGPYGLYDYFDDVYDIEYRIGSDGTFRSVQLMIACGGPNIYIDTASKAVELSWWTDRAHYPLSSEACEEISFVFEEYYSCL